jgi:ABC-type uncharacterized transport system substrate-binding protein
MLQSFYRQAAATTRRLLQGASVDDLPIECPTRFKLVANPKTARAGVTMPTSALFSVDEVIEQGPS